MTRRSNAMPTAKTGRPVTVKWLETMAELYPEQAEMWTKRAQELREQQMNKTLKAGAERFLDRMAK